MIYSEVFPKNLHCVFYNLVFPKCLIENDREILWKSFLPFIKHVGNSQFSWNSQLRIWLKFSNTNLVKILKYEFSWNSQLRIWLKFSITNLVEILKYEFGGNSQLRIWLKFSITNLDEILKYEFGWNSQLRIWLKFSITNLVKFSITNLVEVLNYILRQAEKMKYSSKFTQDKIRKNCLITCHNKILLSTTRQTNKNF